MGDQPSVRPGLSSPDQSQDVEFAIDQQIGEGQRQQDEKESRGPLGPPKMEKRYKSKRQQPEVEKQPAPPETEKLPRGSIR